MEFEDGVVAMLGVHWRTVFGVVDRFDPRSSQLASLIYRRTGLVLLNVRNDSIKSACRTTRSVEVPLCLFFTESTPTGAWNIGDTRNLRILLVMCDNTLVRRIPLTLMHSADPALRLGYLYLIRD